MDRVSLAVLESTVGDAQKEVFIDITRSGTLSNNITVILGAREVLGAVNAAICKRLICPSCTHLTQSFFVSLTLSATEHFTETRQEVMLPAGVSVVTVPIALGQANLSPGETKVFEVYLGPAPGAFVSPITFTNVTIIHEGKGLLLCLHA